jgi:alpha-amylase
MMGTLNVFMLCYNDCEGTKLPLNAFFPVPSGNFEGRNALTQHMYKRFTPVAWCKGSNVYEVNIRQYTEAGTFNAFAGHLPRLRDMGVEILWFMPITPISKEGRQGSLGSYYACSDYVSVNPEFGTLQDFKTLVDEAHGLGMKVIIDWVANHTGWDHTWTRTNPEFYRRTADGKFYDVNGWHDVIDLNYYDHAMRSAMIDAMRFWIEETNIDGFRCDMAHLVPLDFWREARTKLDAIRPLFWLAETENIAYLNVFDSWYTWQWMAATEKYCRQQASLPDLLQVLHHYRHDFPARAIGLYFTANHDENSWNGTEYEKYGDAAKAFAVFSCTWEGIPLIYSGQELPNRKRLKFFDKDQIEWTGTCELHDFYKTLLHLRRQHPALRYDDAAPHFINLGTHEPVLAFTRRYHHRQLVVVLNLSPHEVSIKIPGQQLMHPLKDIFSGRTVSPDDPVVIGIKGWDYCVFVD